MALLIVIILVSLFFFNDLKLFIVGAGCFLLPFIFFGRYPRVIILNQFTSQRNNVSWIKNSSLIIYLDEALHSLHEEGRRKEVRHGTLIRQNDIDETDFTEHEFSFSPVGEQSAMLLLKSPPDVSSILRH